MARSIRGALLAGFAALIPAALPAQDGADESRTTIHGVFNEAQAERGKQLMWNLCAECHVEEDFQGPFLESWKGATVRALFDEIQATMPEDSPSSLERGEYVDVIAYLFKLNGMPTGESEMGTEASILDLITIEIPQP